MVTTPTPIPTDEEKALAAIAEAEREIAEARAERRASAAAAARSLLTGTAERPWRRPLLFVIAFAGLSLDGIIGSAIGSVALALLAYTDSTVEQVEVEA